MSMKGSINFVVSENIHTLTTEEIGWGFCYPQKIPRTWGNKLHYFWGLSELAGLFATLTVECLALSKS